MSLDNLGSLRAAIVATAPVAVPALAVALVGHARYAVEASQLGWRPEVRAPYVLTTDLGNGTPFSMDSIDVVNDEIVGWRYKQLRRGQRIGCYLLVIND